MARRLALLLAALALLAGLTACDPPEYPGGTDQQTWATPDAVPHYAENEAAERVTCAPSHTNWADPIGAPGQRLGSQHRHQFYGPPGVDWTTESPEDLPRSTCEGGISNRTSYWMPTIWDEHGQPVEAPPIENALQVYYKQGYRGVAEEFIEPFPQGLKMLTGDPRATEPQQGNRVWWTCEEDRQLDQGSGSATIPACQPGWWLVANGEFPQCWNGRDLDSPAHGIDPAFPYGGPEGEGGTGHMAYGTGWRSDPSPPESGCPPSHPRALPQVTVHALFEVPEGADTTQWRLGSDMDPDLPGGLTIHWDWWEGWDAQIMSDIVELCLRPSLDCRQGLIPYSDERGLRKLGQAVGVPA